MMFPRRFYPPLKRTKPDVYSRLAYLDLKKSYLKDDDVVPDSWQKSDASSRRYKITGRFNGEAILQQLIQRTKIISVYELHFIIKELC